MSSLGTQGKVTVADPVMHDPAHHNGDPYWDGDQTLWEAVIEEDSGQRHMLFVVARGDAFIPAEIVKRHIEALAASCDPARPTIPQLEALATQPDPSRRPQIRLNIDPPGV
jgi:hypothetical protein